MPTIGHRIQVDAVSVATVFQNEMPTQMPDMTTRQEKSAPPDREARLLVVQN
jgi:hypothetical protein